MKKSAASLVATTGSASSFAGSNNRNFVGRWDMRRGLIVIAVLVGLLAAGLSHVTANYSLWVIPVVASAMAFFVSQLQRHRERHDSLVSAFVVLGGSVIVEFCLLLVLIVLYAIFGG